MCYSFQKNEHWYEELQARRQMGKDEQEYFAAPKLVEGGEI